MGFLDKYLRDNPSQIIVTDDLYYLWLYVEHPTGLVKITVNDSDIKVSLLVKESIPDVEDWVYGGDNGTQYIFKFHNYSQRQQAQSFLISLGYETSTQDFKRD